MSSVSATTSCSRQSPAISSSSAREKTLPVGLCGELTTIARVRLGERRPELVRVDRPVRLVEGDVAGRRPGQDRVRAVVLVERLEDDDLVARVDDPEHRRDHRLGRAAGDRDLRLGVDDPVRDGTGSVLAAIAARSGFAPQVIAYWLMSSWSASMAAPRSSHGLSKSGKPWARLTAPASTASRFISRMTDSVKLAARAEIAASGP